MANQQKTKKEIAEFLQTPEDVVANCINKYHQIKLNQTQRNYKRFNLEYLNRMIKEKKPAKKNRRFYREHYSPHKKGKEIPLPTLQSISNQIYLKHCHEGCSQEQAIEGAMTSTNTFPPLANDPDAFAGHSGRGTRCKTKESGGKSKPDPRNKKLAKRSELPKQTNLNKPEKTKKKIEYVKEEEEKSESIRTVRSNGKSKDGSRRSNKHR